MRNEELKLKFSKAEFNVLLNCQVSLIQYLVYTDIDTSLVNAKKIKSFG